MGKNPSGDERVYRLFFPIKPGVRGLNPRDGSIPAPLPLMPSAVDRTVYEKDGGGWELGPYAEGQLSLMNDITGIPELTGEETPNPD